MWFDTVRWVHRPGSPRTVSRVAWTGRGRLETRPVRKRGGDAGRVGEEDGWVRGWLRGRRAGHRPAPTKVKDADAEGWFDTGRRRTLARLTMRGRGEGRGERSESGGDGGMTGEVGGWVGCQDFVVRHAPPTDSGAAHHERRWVGGGCRIRGCGSTRAGGYTGPAHHER